MVKVLIKPVNLQGIASELPELLPRLGAFEIQIYGKITGKLVKDTLHSKLFSRAWPRLSTVLHKLSQHLPKFSLYITVFDKSMTTSSETDD